MYPNAWSRIHLNLLINFVPGITTLKNTCLNFFLMSGKAFCVDYLDILIALGNILLFIFSVTFCVFLS